MARFVFWRALFPAFFADSPTAAKRPAGNGAAVKWTGHGTSTSGREVNFEGIDIFEVNDDGKIQTVRAYWNPAEMIAQL